MYVLMCIMRSARDRVLSASTPAALVPQVDTRYAAVHSIYLLFCVSHCAAPYDINQAHIDAAVGTQV